MKDGFIDVQNFLGGKTKGAMFMSDEYHNHR